MIASVQHVLDLCQKGDPQIRIHFGSNALAKSGVVFSKAVTQLSPTLSISARIIKPQKSQYIAICLDLDAPAPSMRVLSPALHAIQAELVPEGDADVDGFVRLVPRTKAAVTYAPPNPPPISSGHRYVFVVWEQPESLTNEKIRSQLGLANKVGLWTRARWDQEGCEQKLGLGDVLGGNYFVVGG
jgi:phosphatidylethanolamine-binding protein (PEBP) family uncharacterized protein